MQRHHFLREQRTVHEVTTFLGKRETTSPRTKTQMQNKKKVTNNDKNNPHRSMKTKNSSTTGQIRRKECFAFMEKSLISSFETTMELTLFARKELGYLLHLYNLCFFNSSPSLPHFDRKKYA